MLNLCDLDIVINKMLRTQKRFKHTCRIYSRSAEPKKNYRYILNREISNQSLSA